MTSLQRLIEDHCRRTGETYADIARRGGFTSRSSVHAAATRDYTKTGPRPDTVNKLAKGLNVPESVVRQAIGHDTGRITENLTPRMWTIVSGLQRLDDEGLDAVERRLSHLLAEAQEAAEAERNRKK